MEYSSTFKKKKQQCNNTPKRQGLGQMLGKCYGENTKCGHAVQTVVTGGKIVFLLFILFLSLPSLFLFSSLCASYLFSDGCVGYPSIPVNSGQTLGIFKYTSVAY